MSHARTAHAATLLAIALAAVAAAPAAQAQTDPAAPSARTLEAYPELGDVAFLNADQAPRVTSAGIGPGSLLYLSGKGAECTANFVWQDRAGDLYLGTAGHCINRTSGLFGVSPRTDEVHVCVANCSTHGSASSLGLASPSASAPAIAGLCQIEWTDPDIQEIWDQVCRGHVPGVGGVELSGDFVKLGDVPFSRANGVGEDFALVEIPASLHHLVDPRMPVWGGPTEVFDCTSWTPEPGRPPSQAPTEPGALTYYGHAVGLGEVFPEKARAAPFDTQFGCGYRDESLRAAAPIAFGDSGAAVDVTHAGDDGSVHDRAALGIWTHLGAGGAYGTLAEQAERMVEGNTDLDVEIVTTSSPLPS